MKCMLRANLVCIAAVIVLFAADALADWTINGVAVCTNSADQIRPQLIPDGSGNTIIVWPDQRSDPNNDYWDIYVQKLNYDATTSWTADGVAICTASYGQLYPQLVSDGAGGAIIVWQDSRDVYNVDIYAQRVNASGVPQWTTNGIGVCTASGNQYEPAICTDGSGGAIIAWRDERDSGRDIYAQRINASGAAQWTTNGIGVCTQASSQYTPIMTSDRLGGAIIVWRDYRSAGTPHQYAQKVNSSGVPQWTTDGVELCTASGGQVEPRIAPDGADGAIVTWRDERNGQDNPDIYAQRVNWNGTIQWTSSASAICTATGYQTRPDIVLDGGGYVVIVWEEGRTGYYDVYAQRLNSSGTAQWTANGVAVCAATGSQTSPHVIADNARGTIISWTDYRTSNYADIYAQKLNSSGVAQWTANGVAISTAPNFQSYQQIVHDNAGGAYLAWQDGRSSPNENIYAYRVSSTGQQPVATLLASANVRYDGMAAVLEWTVTEASSSALFSVFRAELGERPVRYLPVAEVEGGELSYHVRDKDVESGGTYRYRLEVAEDGGSMVLFESEPVTIPRAALVLHQNRPNPFNPLTTIEYRIPDQCRVHLAVYDAAGRLVETLVDRTQAAGAHLVEWNGIGHDGRPVGSGVYLYRLIAGKETVSRKMALIR